MIILEFIAIFSCMIFAGAAIYINIAEHPARLECGTELAATVFPPSYNKASVMQAGLAIISTISACGVWFLGGATLWLVGALLIFSVVPFTLIIIMPTNVKLKSPELDKTAESTQAMLELWGRLHFVRSVASLLASVIFLYIVVST
jgi:uncharacterized membrane protein